MQSRSGFLSRVARDAACSCPFTRMARPDEILVVTATLGRSQWLGETVASVDAVRAAGTPLRHRIVAPADAVRELAERFPQTKVVEAAKSGVYPAINRGRENAGDWAAWSWLNDDDRWRPDGVLAALEILRTNPDVDVVYGKVDYIDEAGQRLCALPVERRPDRFRNLMAGGISPLSQHGTFVRRDLADKLGALDEKLRLGADFDYWARAVAAGARFRYIDSVVAEYRLRPNQLSGDVTGLNRDIGLSRERVLGRKAGWGILVAALGFRLRHAGEILGRFRNTGRWRTGELIADAGEGKGAR